MTIRSAVSGPFLTVEAIDVLVMDDLPALFRAFEAAHRAGPFVVLTDTTHMRSAPMPVISAFGDGLKRIPSLSKTWLGDAVVVTSPAVRFVLSTLFMVAPMPTDVKVFADRASASKWCATVLSQAGLNLPPQLRKTA